MYKNFKRGFRRGYSRFRKSYKSFRGGYNRIKSGVSAFTVKQMISSSKRASTSYASRKKKKTMKTFVVLGLIGAIGFLAYTFRDKLKTFLKIGQ